MVESSWLFERKAQYLSIKEDNHELQVLPLVVAVVSNGQLGQGKFQLIIPLTLEERTNLWGFPSRLEIPSLQRIPLFLEQVKQTDMRTSLTSCQRLEDSFQCQLLHAVSTAKFRRM